MPNPLNKKFMAMLIGLVDGDGYIEIGTQKQYHKKTKNLVKSTIKSRLVIRLHSKDRNLLQTSFTINIRCRIFILIS